MLLSVLLSCGETMLPVICDAASLAGRPGSDEQVNLLAGTEPTHHELTLHDGCVQNVYKLGCMRDGAVDSPALCVARPSVTAMVRGVLDRSEPRGYGGGLGCCHVA
jgi:hypothetical protein